MIFLELFLSIVGGVVFWFIINGIHHISLWWILLAPSVVFIVHILIAEAVNAVKESIRKINDKH